MVQVPINRLQVLEGLSSYYIKRSGQTTCYACDSANRQIFSYSQETLVANQYARKASLMFIDTDGTQFLSVEMDFSGYKIMTGDRQLGVLNPMYNPCYLCILQSVSVNSTSGQGKVSMKPMGAPFGGRCFGCCCKGSADFEISVSGQPVGKMANDGSGNGLLVTFPVTLDQRLKGIIVALTFMLFNLYG